MGLRLKFNLAILAALTAGFLVASIVLNRVYFDNAREEILRNARIMMAAANAIRTYTVEELVPLLPSERDGKFVAASVPAYAAQKNFSKVQANFPGFSYREPALNPTNLSDRAQDWEADIINTFRNDAAKADLVVERQTATGPTLHLARPLVVRDQACLACHNTSYDAPVTSECLISMGSGDLI
jgi:hypothetical protein